MSKWLEFKFGSSYIHVDRDEIAAFKHVYPTNKYKHEFTRLYLKGGSEIKVNTLSEEGCREIEQETEDD